MALRSLTAFVTAPEAPTALNIYRSITQNLTFTSPENARLRPTST
jgi:hypothetical protein